MCLFARFTIGTILAIGQALPAICQTQFGRVYHEDNQIGTVSIYAENHGFVACTISFSAKLKQVTCATALPAKFVVFPAKSPQLLTTLTYEPGRIYSFNYSHTSQFGIYTRRSADSSYVYSLPFELISTAERRVFDGRHQRMMHHHYFFNLPENTPVHAAREGIVASIRQDKNNAEESKPNYLIIFHDNGTYAEYTYFNQNSVAVKVGQRVGKGEVLCYAGGLKKRWFRFCVLHPGAINGEEIPVAFEGEH